MRILDHFTVVHAMETLPDFFFFFLGTYCKYYHCFLILLDAKLVFLLNRTPFRSTKTIKHLFYWGYIFIRSGNTIKLLLGTSHSARDRE